METDPLNPKVIGLALPSIAFLRQIPLSVVLAAIVLVASVYIPRFRYKSQLVQFPLFLEHMSSEERRAKFLVGAKALYKDDHQKFKGMAYRMQTLDEEQIVLPLYMFPELRKAPEDVLSFYDMFSKRIEETYTYVDIKFLPQVVNTIKRHYQCIHADAHCHLTYTDGNTRVVGMYFPAIIETYFRRVRKGYTLSNGQYLPPGVPIVMINPLVTDSQHNTFDGFRHYRLRESNAQKDKPNHRWLIANYDIKMPGGETGLEARYAMVEHGNMVMEPRDKSLMIRRVTKREPVAA